MYLTEERLEQLKEKKAKSEVAAKKTLEEKIFPAAKDKLADYIEENIVPLLVAKFDDECKKAAENGYFTTPMVRLTVTKMFMTWNISFQRNEKSTEELKHDISNVRAFDIENVKRLIEAACEKVKTRMIPGELDSSEMFTAYIEIDLR